MQPPQQQMILTNLGAAVALDGTLMWSPTTGVRGDGFVAVPGTAGSLRATVQADGSLLPRAICASLETGVGVAFGRSLRWVDPTDGVILAEHLLKPPTGAKGEHIEHAGSVTGSMDYVWAIWSSNVATIVDLAREKTLRAIPDVVAAATVRNSKSSVAFLLRTTTDGQEAPLEIHRVDADANSDAAADAVTSIRALVPSSSATSVRLDAIVSADRGHYRIAVTHSDAICVHSIGIGIGIGIGKIRTTRCLPPPSVAAVDAGVPAASFGLHGFASFGLHGFVGSNANQRHGLVATWHGNQIRWTLENRIPSSDATVDGRLVASVGHQRVHAVAVANGSPAVVGWTTVVVGGRSPRPFLTREAMAAETEAEAPESDETDSAPTDPPDATIGTLAAILSRLGLA